MKNRIYLLGAGLIILTVAIFQNCSPVQFSSLSAVTPVYGVDPNGNPNANPQYAEAKVGSSQKFPPLKLIFVVDNSGTMGLNQVNLSKAFAKVFDGSNSANLSAFDTSAMLITTSQASVLKTDPVFNRIPSQDVSQFESLPYSSLMKQYRGPSLTGEVPGDILGYRVQRTDVSGKTSLNFFPAPVLGFQPQGNGSTSSPFARLPLGGSIDNFKADLQARLALLDPDRSATVTDASGTTTGILDPVVDRESGLCALARVLKHPNGLVNQGDVAAFVIVSDEDDNDPKGMSCLDSVNDADDKADLFDGRCVRPSVQISYRAPLSNPTHAKCSVGYSRGFNYSYSYPVKQTQVQSKVVQYSYVNKQVNLVYSKLLSHHYDVESTPVSYFTKAPTYEIPQTKVTFYRQVENCVMRDGVKTKCTSTFPADSVVLLGSSGSDCSNFVSGKLPAGALISDPLHWPVCSAAPGIPQTGSCSDTETSKVNCKQNYSQAQMASIPGRVTGTDCTSFVQAKFPNAVADSGFAPQCQPTVVTQVTGAAGPCPASGLLNCQNDISTMATTKTVVGATPLSAADCQALILKNDSSAYAGDLVNYPMTCTAGANSSQLTADGVCPASDNVKVCVAALPPRLATFLVDGVISQANCLSDPGVKAKLSSFAILTGADAPVCSTAPDRTQTSLGLASYTNPIFNGVNITANSTCPQLLQDSLKTSVGVALTSCRVTTLDVTSQVFSNLTADVTCSATDVAGYCLGSAGLRRDCVGTDVAAGDPYAPTPTLLTVNENVTCDTPCAGTNFCKTKSGLVKDNYYQCAVKAQSLQTISAFMGQTASNSQCAVASDQRIVTQGPYHSITPVMSPVADQPPQSADILSDYIKARSTDLFGAGGTLVSVFVRQHSDPLGQGGTFGDSYNRFALSMNGSTNSVLSNADVYGTALQGLTNQVRERLSRSFSIEGVKSGQMIRNVWHRRAGQTDWGAAVDHKLWTQSGSSVTLQPDVDLQLQDEFRFEYW